MGSVEKAELVAVSSVEHQVNHEGLDSLFLFERLHNPTIRKQIINLSCEADQTLSGQTIEVPRRQENGDFVYDENWHPLFEEKPYVPQTPEEMEEQFDKTLLQIERETLVSFDKEDHVGPYVHPAMFREIMPLDWIYPLTGKKATQKMMSICEAHEKGHVIRRHYVYNPYLMDKFQKAFDQGNVTFTEQDYKYMIAGLPQKEPPPPFEDAREIFFQYIFSAHEIAERMSQLKSYFSIKDDAPFTKEHLTYAREHYIEDTGLDNQMTPFFQAITPGKEAAFLELINSAGI